MSRIAQEAIAREQLVGLSFAVTVYLISFPIFGPSFSVCGRQRTPGSFLLALDPVQVAYRPADRFRTPERGIGTVLINGLIQELSEIPDVLEQRLDFDHRVVKASIVGPRTAPLGQGAHARD